MIFGTHNSVSRRIIKSNNKHLTAPERLLKTISPALWESLVVCQDKTITQQIQSGAAALDIRIAEYNDELVVAHTDIVAIYDDVVEEIITSTENMSDSDKPIIFLIIEWNYHEAVDVIKRENVLKDAKDRLVKNSYPERQIYTGTSWANIKGEDNMVNNYRPTTILQDHTIQSYQRDIDSAKTGETTVIFTQLTTDSYILGIELVLRFIIPILSIVIVYILCNRKIIRNVYMNLIWIPVYWLILQYFIPGLMNTPRSLNEHRVNEIKSNLECNNEPCNVIIMLDFI